MASPSWPSTSVSCRVREILDNAPSEHQRANPGFVLRLPRLSGPTGRTPASRCTGYVYLAGVSQGIRRACSSARSRPALELDGSVAHQGKFRLLQPQSPGNRIALPLAVSSDSAVLSVESTQIGRARNRLTHWAFCADFDVSGLSGFRNIPDWICAWAGNGVRVIGSAYRGVQSCEL